MRTLFVILFSAFAGAVSAQHSYLFTSYTVNDGLPQGTIYDITQDSTGFIWIATGDGICRFDGFTFKNYKLPMAGEKRHDNRFSSLITGPHNTLWVSNDYGIYRFSVSHEIFRKIPLGNLREGYEPALIDAQHNGAVYFTLGSQIAAYYPATETIDLLYEDPEDDNSYCSKICDPSGRYIAVTTAWGKLIIIDLLTRKTIQDPLPEFPGISSLIFDRENLYALGADGIVIRIRLQDGKIREVSRLRDLSPSVTFPCHGVMDRYGQIWNVMPVAGLVAYEVQTGTSIPIIPSSLRHTDLSDERIISLFIDRSENLWMGTTSRGIHKINLKASKFRSIHADSIPAHDFIRSIYVFDDGTVMAGTNNYGFWLKDKEGNTQFVNLPHRNPHQQGVFVISRVSSDEVLIGTYYGIYLYNRIQNLVVPVVPANSSGRKRQFVTSLCALDSTSWVYGGSDAFGIIQKKGSQYNCQPIFDQDGLIIRAITVDQGKIYFQKDTVLITAAYREGRFTITDTLMTSGELFKSILVRGEYMWAATPAGLMKLHLMDGSTQVFAEESGLSHSFVYSIVPDSQGHLWLSTNHGIFRFDEKKSRFTHYTITDGLPGNEYNSGAWFSSPDGQIWFGGMNGITAFDPAHMPENPYGPTNALTQLVINDVSEINDPLILSGKFLRLGYTQNTISLEFSALEFTDPLQNKYMYYLEGADKEWVYSGTRRFARYASLPPGTYVFKVKSSNDDDTWGDETVLFTFSIVPPFWQTTWFRLTSVLTVTGIVIFVIVLISRFRRKRALRIIHVREQSRLKAIIETEEKERKRVAQELHDSLGQLLSTAKLNMMSLEDDISQENATPYQFTLQLIDEACHELRTISHNMMPSALIRLGLAPALRELADKISSGNIIQVHLETEGIQDKRLDDIYEISIYRIIQELINNTLRHAGASKIRVSVRYLHPELVLHYEDNGKGWKPGNDSGGIGWKNIRSRIDMLDGHIKITPMQGEGFQIHILWHLK